MPLRLEPVPIWLAGPRSLAEDLRAIEEVVEVCREFDSNVALRLEGVETVVHEG